MPEGEPENHEDDPPRFPDLRMAGVRRRPQDAARGSRARIAGFCAAHGRCAGFTGMMIQQRM